MTPMLRSLLPLALLAALGAGCSQTTVTVLTQGPPGRAAYVDAEARTLTLSRGVAVALECTSWSEAYSGPCRELAPTLDDESLATLLPVHVDALPRQLAGNGGHRHEERAVRGTADRAGFVLVAAAAGEGELTVLSQDGPPLTLALVVEEPPAPPTDE